MFANMSGRLSAKSSPAPPTPKGTPASVASTSSSTATIEWSEEDHALLNAHPKYHPNSIVFEKAGYYPNLSPAQVTAVKSLQDKLDNDGLRESFDDGREIYLLKCLRFLRPNRFNVDKTLEMIKNHIAWKEESNRNHYHELKMNEAHSFNALEFYGYSPAWFQGFDKEERPVVYRKFANFEMWNILKLMNMDQLLNYHAWNMERVLSVMAVKTQEREHIVEHFIAVQDLANTEFRLVTSDLYSFIRGLSSLDSEHYPELLGTMIIINAPSVLPFVFGMVKPFLNEFTKAKIQIFAGREQWEPVLLSLIDRDQLPKQYGGDAPDLTPEECLASMEP